MEALLFERAISALPAGTAVKAMTGPMGIVPRNVGRSQQDGTIDGKNFKAIHQLLGFKSRSVSAKALYVPRPPDGSRVPVGVAVLMVRAIGRSQAQLDAFLREADSPQLPGYLEKIWLAWVQNYRDGMDGAGRTFHTHGGQRYTPSCPDGYIYDKDHKIAKCNGGSDLISNKQAISLISHRVKTAVDMRLWRAAGAGKKRRRAVRRNARYWMRASRARSYTFS